ncbi:MAG: cytochrome c3 family protein [Desulfuromonadales bacterium]|nr:cytochrome c3 family protein [Desulfuromonadales bacterium]
MMRLLTVPLLLLFCAAPALALELVYPQDGSYVTNSRYLIIQGGRAPWLDGLTIEINGIKSDIIDISSPEYQDLFGDTLKVEPIFDAGENRIVIEGYIGNERIATVRATVFYHNDPEADPPATLPQDRYHRIGRATACGECHNVNPTPTELNSHNRAENPCASCHERMLHKKHVHGPAGVYECNFCHQADSRPVAYAPRPGDAALCLECHDDIGDAMAASKFIHGPLEAGSCLLCHDAHASEFGAQVIRPVNELCLGCHEKVAKSTHVVRTAQGKGHPLDGDNNLIEQGGELTCASCHNPHAADTSAYLAFGVTSRMALCGNCHKK